MADRAEVLRRVSGREEFGGPDRRRAKIFPSSLPKVVFNPLKCLLDATHLLVRTIDFTNDSFTYRLLAGGGRRGTRSIGFGRNRWVEGTSALGRPHEYPAAASGAWTSERRFELSICQLDSPHTLTVGFTFEGDTAIVDRRINVSFGPTESEPITGRASR